MSAPVVLVDYGSGNLHSVEKAVARAAGDAITVTSDPEVVRRAERLVLPGVGAFSHCMDLLGAQPGLIEAMDEAVHQRGAPFIGVCVGMQLLATRGLEFGDRAGLDWISGEVRRIEPAGRQFKVPHMGWNALSGVTDHALFEGLEDGAHLYFTHSFALHPNDPSDVAARTDHGGPITAAVVRGNVAGVQFHPEKSQAAGLRLLTNFLRWTP